MLENYNYILIFICDDNNHICHMYSSIAEIAKELDIHRTTISKKLKNNRCEIIKNHEKYYIIKL